MYALPTTLPEDRGGALHLPDAKSMRLVETIPHPHCRISIMSYNDKWIIEIEAAQYKQTYKIGHDSVNGLEDVRKLISTDLLAQTLERFRDRKSVV